MGLEIYLDREGNGRSTRIWLDCNTKMLSNGEKCGCRLLKAFEITQPTLSHHMKILCECGLVNDRKEGKWHHYSINSNICSELSSFLNNVGKVE